MIKTSLGSIDDRYRGMHPWFNDDPIGNLPRELGALVGRACARGDLVGQVTYQPPGVPVQVGLDTQGNLSLGVTNSVQTPIGTFSVSATGQTPLRGGPPSSAAGDGVRGGALAPDVPQLLLRENAGQWAPMGRGTTSPAAFPGNDPGLDVSRAQFFIQVLKTGDDESRIRACHVLAQPDFPLNSVDAEQAKKVLFDLLSETGPRVRVRVARTLLALCMPRRTSADVMMCDSSLSFLTKALKERDSDVRLSAAKTLGAVGPLAKQCVEDVVPALAAAYKAAWWDAERTQMLDALHRIDPEAAKRLE